MSHRSVKSAMAAIILAATGLAAYCDSPTQAPTEPPCVFTTNVCAMGTVNHVALEGGFWVVRGDDSVSYDPIGGMPAEFQVEGLRVRLVAKKRPDAVSFHMYGTIVEIISITKL